MVINIDASLPWNPVPSRLVLYTTAYLMPFFTSRISSRSFGNKCTTYIQVHVRNYELLICGEQNTDHRETYLKNRDIKNQNKADPTKHTILQSNISKSYADKI